MRARGGCCDLVEVPYTAAAASGNQGGREGEHWLEKKGRKGKSGALPLLRALQADVLRKISNLIFCVVTCAPIVSTIVARCVSIAPDVRVILSQFNNSKVRHKGKDSGSKLPRLDIG